MRRTSMYVAAWFAAGAAAVLLASAAVSMVGNEVTGSRPSPLTADQVRAELLAEADTTSTTTPESSSTSTDSVPTPGTTPPSAVSGASPPRTPSPSSTTSTTQAAVPSETRTYNLQGGTATLRFTPNGVTVEVATPKPGFSVTLEPTHGNGVEVEFASESHRSEVKGWWEGGPRDEIREDERD